MKTILLMLAMLASPAIALAGESAQLSAAAQPSAEEAMQLPVAIQSSAEDAVPLPVAPQPSEVSPDLSPADEALNNLAFYALSLIGTPYKYGGNSPDTGFDCSGFVGHVFRKTLGISLPRSAHEINHLGQAIKANELRPGDLVFYNTLKRAFSHVGIYLGDDRFVHSPSRGGSIRVENMQENYWRKRFNGARRIALDQQVVAGN